MDNHPFSWVNQLNITIFHSYVSLPEGKLTPKSSILVGLSLINHPLLGIPMTMEPPIYELHNQHEPWIPAPLCLCIQHLTHFSVQVEEHWATAQIFWRNWWHDIDDVSMDCIYIIYIYIYNVYVNIFIYTHTYIYIFVSMVYYWLYMYIIYIHISLSLGVSMVMGVHPNGWMVFVRENPIEIDDD